jgi:LuxR family maltose regulon positive regulatory protein
MTSSHKEGPLLETKLYIPRLRRGQVARPRLTERLSRGAESKLTLVSAPAGFGKTALLAEWSATIADDAPSPAWLSLDRSDSQPTTFWSYVIAALQTVAPGVGTASLSMLREPQPPPIESILATLVNELSATSTRPVLVIVLDDYHLIDAQEIHEGVAFLLEHLPPHVHVVVATRARSRCAGRRTCTWA